MPLPRFYLPPQAWLGSAPSLSKEDSYHCGKVLRMDEGDSIRIFDGAGREAKATIVAMQKKTPCLIAIEEPLDSRPLPSQLVLAQAVPKAKNMDLIIQKAVELGVSRIVPLLSERTVLRCADENDILQKQERWQSIAIEACKQCGQNWLPHVDQPCSVEAFLKKEKSEFCLIASLEKESRSLKEVLTESIKEPKSVTVMIGPEGDFTTEEYDLAKKNTYQPISLGPIILRTETAALYCLSVLAHEFF